MKSKTGFIVLVSGIACFITGAFMLNPIFGLIVIGLIGIFVGGNIIESSEKEGNQ